MSSILTNASIRLVSLLLFLFIWFGSSFLFNSSLLPGPIDVFEKVILEIESDELFFSYPHYIKKSFLIIYNCNDYWNGIRDFHGKKRKF